jgi:hypothetical protein
MIPQRGHPKTPPINGVFPLDKSGLCKEAAALVIACLRNQSGPRPETIRDSNGLTPGDINHQSGTKGSHISPGRPEDCTELAKAYLDCRLREGLMDRDDWRWSLTLRKSEDSMEDSLP